MNSIFNRKTHRSYFLREKADLRSKVMEKKFMQGHNREMADNKRILADYEKQLREDAKNQQDRMSRKLSMAKQAKEFQIK